MPIFKLYQKGWKIRCSFSCEPRSKYLLPEDEVKTSNIERTEVTFGYRSMPYSPYHSETHEPSGYYDMYVAEFEKDGIEFQIVAQQMEAKELVKVVTSIIRGDANIIIT